MRCISLLLLVLLTKLALAQNTPYLGFEASLGTGTTFINIQHLGHENSHLRSTYSPMVTLGIPFRYDIKGKFSLQTGINYNFRSYKASYPRSLNFSSSNKIGYFENGNYLSIPILFKYRYNFGSSKNWLIIGGGGALEVQATNTTKGTSFRGIYLDSTSPLDSADQGVINYLHIKSGVNVILLATLGYERPLGKRSLISIQLAYGLGTKQQMEGEFRYYKNKIRIGQTLEDQIPKEDPAEAAKITSNNSFLSLSVCFFIPVKKK